MKIFRRFSVAMLSLISSFSLSAQTDLKIPNWHFIDKMTVPFPTEDMPDYAKLLYADEVNVIELEAAYTAYYEDRGWDKVLEDLEHDAFAKFYHRWYQNAANYIEEDGTVKVLSTAQLLQEREAIAALNTSKDALKSSPSSAWSFLGPKRTLWRKEHDDAQIVAPWQVNLYCIAVAPSDASILYAGSETGALYKTTDKGLNWTPFDNFNFGRAILSVAIHPTNPNIVLAATSADIMRTTDGGASWSIVETQSGLSCNSIEFSPSNPSVIAAGTGNGLYLSTDGGTTWTQKISGRVDDVAFRPGDGTTLYALTQGGTPAVFSFYKSTDSGSSFNLSMSGFPTNEVSSGGRITVTPADPDYVYALLLAKTGANSTPLVVKSINAANAWNTVATCPDDDCGINNGQGYYDLDIVASHVNAEHLIGGTTSAYKSIDGGVNWTIVGGYGGNFAIHPDLQALVVTMDGANEDTWLTTDGGVNYSSDFYSDVANWEARIDGIDGTNFWGFSQGWNEDYIVGGRYHNGNTVIHENYPDKQALRLGGAESVTGWAMHGRERHAAFDDIAELIVPDVIDGISEEGSFLFTKHPAVHYYGDAFGRVMVDLEDFMKVYTCAEGAFWKSEDGGGSWISTYTFPGQPYHFDISRADGNYIYQTTNTGFFRSTDSGETFTEMNLPAGMSDWHAQNFRVAASSLNRDRVWLLNQRSGANSSAGRVFESIDGGANWTDITSPDFNGRKWTAIAHQASVAGALYVASERGDAGTMPAKVMYRDDNTGAWLDFSNNLPQSANPIKLLPFYRDGKLRWGGNRGAWEVDFYEENWAPIAQPFVSGKNQFCARDVVEFDSYSVAKGTATYAWSIPGTATVTDLNTREVLATFPGPGTYTATLTVSQDGMSDSKSVTITIGNECEAEDKPGNALSLSGEASDYAATNNPLNLNTNTLTMSAWIKRNGDQNANAGLLFLRGTSANGLNFGSNNELRFHWNDSQWWWDSGLLVPDNEWAHVAMVVSPSETTLYLNGVPAVNTADNGVGQLDAVLNFGRDPNSGSRRFKGEMDEVLVYNRVLSQNEIRELMHLTRVPAQETDLVGYWQFNRMEGTIADRIASNHASLVGAAARNTSSAPVGPGSSARMTVNTGGEYAFSGTGLSLEFPAGATTYPDGEICVTRLDRAPDQVPGEQVSDAYWIIRNYGNNSTFDELSSLTFEEIGQVDLDMVTEPSQLKLYKRGSGQYGASWGSSVDNAESAVAGNDGDVVFSTNNGQTSFSQFIIAYESLVLPVDLVSFYAVPDRGGKVRVNWTSYNEIDFLDYEVQKSLDGKSFETIDKINARGGNLRIDYTTLDKKNSRGKIFYRLKMNNIDGTFTFSPIRAVLINALSDDVVLFPNPIATGDNLSVETMIKGEMKIRLYDSRGEDVAEFEQSGSGTLRLPDLPKGLYGYTIEADGVFKSGVLLVQ